MKTLYPFVGILILILAITPDIVLAQTDSDKGHDSTYLVDFTLFPKTDPFESDKIIRITLKFDMKRFFRTKYKGEYQKAQLTLHNPDSSIVEKEIRVRARGITRRSICHFPPIKLNFKETAFENDTLNDINSLKLVTHCKNSDLYEQYLLKEYLVYRMYNLVTDSSYRVKLLHIDYIDSEDKMKPLTKYGFIIESNDHLAERLQGTRIDKEGINTWDTDRYLTSLLDIFQYMIGNTDWSIPPLHNVRLVKPSVLNSSILAIPYDFDYSGMVNTVYAVPDENLGTETVRTRVYRGYCLPSDDHYQRLFKVFKENKQAMFSLVEDFELLDNSIDTTYSHIGMAAVNGLHRYYVTSTYEEGESGPSNIEVILIDGIENVSIASDLVYPNPFTNEVNVKLEENIRSLEVINSQGQVVFSKEGLKTPGFIISLDNQPAGVYNLRIETQRGWENHTMIKM